MLGADLLLKALEEQGVDTVFGLPGGSVIPLYDRLKHFNIRHILTRHEQGAVHAADGYARATGKVGVCFATSGPGAANLVTGIATAQMDSIPLVVITGQVPRSMIGTDAFQEIDITGISAPITKHNYLIQHVEDIPRIVAEAFHIASTGRPGPVLIDIPRDVAQAKCEYVPVTEVDIRSYKPNVYGHSGMMKRAVKILRDAQKLVICVGGGVVNANVGEEVRQLAEKKNATVVSTMMGLSGYAEDERFLGMLGTYGNAGANKAVQDCDCLLALGMRFDDRVISVPDKFAPNAQIIHVDIDPAEIGKNVDIDVPIVGDLRNVVKALNEQLDKEQDIIRCSVYPKEPIPREAGLSVPWMIEKLQEAYLPFHNISVSSLKNISPMETAFIQSVFDNDIKKAAWLVLINHPSKSYISIYFKYLKNMLFSLIPLKNLHKYHLNKAKNLKTKIQTWQNICQYL